MKLAGNDSDNLYAGIDNYRQDDNDVVNPDDANAYNDYADSHDAHNTKTNDYDTYNVEAADDDIADANYNSTVDADADISDYSPNTKDDVSDDIDANDYGTYTNNPAIDGLEAADDQNDLALLSSAVQRFLAPVILVRYVNLKHPDKGKFITNII